MARTPWGRSQGCEPTGFAGIEFYWTEGHGGYYVSRARTQDMRRHRPEAMAHCIEDERTRGTWWEEDCAWAWVALVFPEAFPPEAQAAAERTVDHYYRRKE